jgi:hypothetical protein
MLAIILVGRDHLLGNLGTAPIKPAHNVQMNPSWEDEFIHMGKIFPAFYGTRMVITVVLKVRHPQLKPLKSISFNNLS